MIAWVMIMTISVCACAALLLLEAAISSRGTQRSNEPGLISLFTLALPYMRCPAERNCWVVENCCLFGTAICKQVQESPTGFVREALCLRMRLCVCGHDMCYQSFCHGCFTSGVLWMCFHSFLIFLPKDRHFIPPKNGGSLHVHTGEQSMKKYIKNKVH